MKVNLLKITGIFALAILLFTGCNQSTKVKEKKGTTSTGHEASVEVEVFDAMKIKDQLVELIQQSPKPEEITDFLNKAKASFILDLTISSDDLDKYMTETELSIAMGLYSFDLLYAKTFNRSDVVAGLASVEDQIIDKLGIRNGHNSFAKYSERLRANGDNKDSLDFLVTEMMNESYATFMECEHSYVYALSFIAANIEGLYILSQLTMFAENNTAMIEFLGQQNERAKSIYSLVELMSEDSNVKPYYESLKQLAVYFNTHPDFTEKELNEVFPLIESARSKFVK